VRQHQHQHQHQQLTELATYSDEIVFKGKTYPVKDTMLAILGISMHLDPDVFPDPMEFKPERWVGANAAAIPRNAFRSFEKGVRACMGQNLAMAEMKIFLVLVARWLDFELRDHNPAAKPRASLTNLDTKIGDHAYQQWGLTTAPRGPVMIKLTETVR
jgi:cytochrome P450